MSSNTKDSISAQIQILRVYLESMERSIKTDNEKYQAEKVELDNQANELRKRIEEERNKEENLSEEEQERRFEEAYEKWEATWIDGDPYGSYSSYDPQEYYDSPEYELELLEIEINEHSYWDLTFDFSDVLRSSFFTHIYSFIEYSMNLKCEEVKSLKNCAFTLDDLRSQGIFRTKIYFQKATGIDLESIAEWKDFENYNKVRNCLVHARGYIALSRDAKELKKYIPKVDLSITHGKIEIKEAYCRKALDTIEKFFDELEKRIAAL